MHKHQPKSVLAAANHLMRKAKYREAIELYKEFQCKYPTLSQTVIASIEICERRIASNQDIRLSRRPSSLLPTATAQSTQNKAMLVGGDAVIRSGVDDYKLRSLEALTPVAVVINALDGEMWKNISAAIIDLNKLEYDAYILAHEQCDLTTLPTGLCSATYLGPADEPGNARGFVRAANTQIFSRYEAVLWISPSHEDNTLHSAATHAIKQIETFRSASNCGWLSNDRTRVSINKKINFPTLAQQVRLTIERLGIGLGDESLDIPSGPVVLMSPLLLTATRPPYLNLSELKSESESEGKGGAGRNVVMALLALAAKTAGMEIFGIESPPSKPLTAVDRTVKAIAFYLPQFHPIPENDEWWGKGFTEWTNVTKAKQLFRYHYQPRLPSNLGFYDLRLEETQIAQADLARQFGVHGFCYYYYWFNGKKLLNHPIEQMARSSRIDIGFCVCWANENWSRNWDGQNRHILMKQEYKLESNVALMRDEIIPMMKDPRWVRHNGKPVMVVYRISLIPNWIETALAWRDECRRAGLGEIHLCAVRFGLEKLEGQPRDYELDSYVLFPPHEAPRKDIRQSVLDLNKNFGGEIFDYTTVVNGDLEKYANGYAWPVHRGAMLGWDNTARRHTAARIFHGATPLGFRRWIKGIVEQESKFNSSSESIVFINAWNEWAEGTYLEPDMRWGTANLEALSSGLRSVPASNPVLLPKAAALRSKLQGVLDKLGAPFESRGAALVPPVFKSGQRGHDPSLPTVLLCAHVAGHQLFGGERSFLDVLNALDEMPINVVVTLPSGNNKIYLQEICRRSHAVYVFTYPQWMNNRDNYGWLSSTFAEIIAKHNVDIVHANTIVLSEPLTAARWMGRQSVVHVRELISLDDSLRERMALHTSDIVTEVFKRADWVIGNSEATCKLFAKGEQTCYVPNAVSLPEFDMSNKFGNIIKFGIVSSNIPKKGVGDFVEVARRVATLSSRANFVVIGPKNDQIRKWEEEVKQGERPNNITFLGYRETPRAAMSELNVLLSLSHFAESFGRTLAEASAARRPVIAYNWGALSELVIEGETGILLPYRDIDAVVSAVKSLCDDSEKIIQMGNNARAFIAQNFSQASLQEALRKCYAKILNLPMSGQRDSEFAGTCARPIHSLIGNAPRATIVIPVYNALDQVRDCIASIVKHTDLTRNRVLVIDDGSPDPEIFSMLNGFEGIPGLEIRHNRSNIGYTKTINLGISECGNDDVVLLNSDTIVTPKWLEGLRAAAYSRSKVGTVTAMSDNAGAFSFPTYNEFCRKPEHLTHEEYALLLLHETQSCVPPEVPTGSGFCMFIRRALIDECGLFDHEAFPRGYGEENDFCMRAVKAGWLNLVSPWSFVYHIRTASFKGEKAALVKAGIDVVTKRYPDYAASVKTAFNSPNMLNLREASSRILHIYK